MNQLTQLEQFAPLLGVATGDVERGLSLMIVGMSVVFVSLVAIGLVIAGVSRLFASRRAAAPSAEASRPKAPAEEIDPRTIAILAAAATAVVNKPVRIHRVVMLGHQSNEPWVTGGRATLLGSHRPPGR